MAKLNVDKARAAGYSDQEIEQFVRDNDLEIKSTAGGFGRSLVNSTGRLLGDTAKAILNPVQTVKGIGSVALGGLQNLIPGEQGQEKNFNQLADYYGTRYGVKSALRGDLGQAAQDIYRTGYFDPAGTALDVAGLASGVGAGAKGAAGLASRGARATSLSSPTAKIGRFGAQASKFANTIDPLYQAGSMAGSGIKGIGSKLEDFSKQYTTAGIGNPQTLGGIKKYGLNAADMFEKYPELMSRDPQTARGLKSTLGSQYDEIARAGGSLDQGNISRLAQAFEDEISNLQRQLQINPDNPQIANQLQQTINQRNNLSRQILANMDQSGSVPIQPVREFRQTVTGTPSKLNSPNLQGSALADEFARRQTRSAINRSDPRLRQLGLEQAALGGDKKGIIGALQSAENRGEAAKPINVGNLGAGGFGFGAGFGLGGPLGGLFGAATSTAAKNYLNSPTGVRQVSGAIRGTGRGLQQTERLASPLSKYYQGSRAGSIVNRSSEMQGQEQQTVPQSRPTVRQQSSSNFTPQNTQIKLFTDRNKRRIF